MCGSKDVLSDEDYKLLADFRYLLRQFMAFSEVEASGIGLTPQQHQALLAIRVASPAGATVGFVAERLVLKPHTATGLIDRLEALGLVTRVTSPADGRRVLLQLTAKASTMLTALTAAHREEIKRIRPMLGDVLQRFADTCP